VRYWAATLPRLVRQGDRAGAAQDDMGQSLASTRRKSSSRPVILERPVALRGWRPAVGGVIHMLDRGSARRVRKSGVRG
jgi:hypothetical protein